MHELTSFSPVSDCGMSFRLEKQVVESSPLQAMPHSIPAEGLTPAPPKVVVSLPVEPGDFQRVRLLLLNGPLQSETRSTEAESFKPPSAGSNQYENLVTSLEGLGEDGAGEPLCGQREELWNVIRNFMKSSGAHHNTAGISLKMPFLPVGPPMNEPIVPFGPNSFILKRC